MSKSQRTVLIMLAVAALIAVAVAAVAAAPAPVAGFSAPAGCHACPYGGRLAEDQGGR